MESAEVMRVLGRKYNPEILCSAHEPKTVKEFSERLDIPIATCYRRIDELEEIGLVELHDQQFTDSNRVTNVYRRNVDAIEITFASGSMNIEFEEEAAVQHKLDNIWRDLSEI